MTNNLKTNRIFRILAGIYLLYLSTRLWTELDASNNKNVGMIFIILFALVGVALIIASAIDLIKMYKNNESSEEDSNIENVDDNTDIEGYEEISNMEEKSNEEKIHPEKRDGDI